MGMSVSSLHNVYQVTDTAFGESKISTMVLRRQRRKNL